jgi:hypothetical protein
MKLGVFSMSLNVNDIKVSKLFYENLGFSLFGGSIEQKYLIMKNGDSLIGLFQGMFENNILTFNPGWDANANTVEGYQDIRSIEAELKAKGIKLDRLVAKDTKGPGSLSCTDPDGNIILIDQHI